MHPELCQAEQGTRKPNCRNHRGQRFLACSHSKWLPEAISFRAGKLRWLSGLVKQHSWRELEGHEAWHRRRVLGNTDPSLNGDGHHSASALQKCGPRAATPSDFLEKT